MLSDIFSASPWDKAAMGSALTLLFIISGVLLLCAIVLTVLAYTNRKGNKLILTCLWITTVFALLCTLLCLSQYRQAVKSGSADVPIGTTFAPPQIHLRSQNLPRTLASPP